MVCEDQAEAVDRQDLTGISALSLEFSCEMFGVFLRDAVHLVHSGLAQFDILFEGLEIWTIDNQVAGKSVGRLWGLEEWYEMDMFKLYNIFLPSLNLFLFWYATRSEYMHGQSSPSEWHFAGQCYSLVWACLAEGELNSVFC